MIVALLLLTSDEWKRPWATAKVIAEVPYGIGGGAEVFFHNEWSAGADMNVSPIGTFYRLSFSYWPVLRRGLTYHQFLLGLGGDVSATFSTLGTAAVIVPAAVDARY